MTVEYKTTEVPPLYPTKWTHNECLEALLEREWKEGAWELVCQVDKWGVSDIQPQSVLVFKRGK